MVVVGEDMVMVSCGFCFGEGVGVDFLVSREVDSEVKINWLERSRQCYVST